MGRQETPVLPPFKKKSQETGGRRAVLARKDYYRGIVGRIFFASGFFFLHGGVLDDMRCAFVVRSLTLLVDGVCCSWWCTTWIDKQGMTEGPEDACSGLNQRDELMRKRAVCELDDV